MTSLIKTTLKVFSVVKKTWELDIIILSTNHVKKSSIKTQELVNMVNQHGINMVNPD